MSNLIPSSIQINLLSLNKVLTKIDALDRKVDQVLTKVASFERKVDQNKEQLEQLIQRIDAY